MNCHDVLLFLQRNSHTALGAYSRYLPIRFRHARSARIVFPTARPDSLHATAMSGRSGAKYASLADTLWEASVCQVPLVYSLGARARLWTCRQKSKLRHCQFCVSRVSFPPSSQALNLSYHDISSMRALATSSFKSVTPVINVQSTHTMSSSPPGSNGR